MGILYFVSALFNPKLMTKNCGDWATKRPRSTPQLMKLTFAFLVLSIILAGCATTDNVQTRQTEGFRNLLDAVVRLDVREASYSRGMKQTVRGVGSGVILDDQGYILTNAHVVGIDAE